MFQNYIKLLSRIDSFVAGVMERRPDSFMCGPGCCKCCVAGLTVWRVEADHISAEANAVSPGSESRKDACVFLDKENRCGIYEVRPVVCRIWGAPLLIPAGCESDWGLRDSASLSSRRGALISCDLNFAGGADLQGLPDGDVLNAETALTALAAINHVYCREAGLDPGERMPLSSVT